MNNPPNPASEKSEPQGPLLRPHSYDGIQEYDNKLPNWWLWTLWLAVAFSVVYWAVGHWWSGIGDPGEKLVERMEENARSAALNAGSLSDEQLWTMSRDQAMVSAGRAIFLSNCASCHKPDLTGQIGPNLVDNTWIHGGRPNDIVKIITEGVPAKGMPTWGPVLGRAKITQVAAFVLSHHDPSAPATTSPAPPASGSALAPASQ